MLNRVCLCTSIAASVSPTIVECCSFLKTITIFAIIFSLDLDGTLDFRFDMSTVCYILIILENSCHQHHSRTRKQLRLRYRYGANIFFNDFHMHIHVCCNYTFKSVLQSINKKPSVNKCELSFFLFLLSIVIANLIFHIN